jgi:hypothetical protein
MTLTVTALVIRFYSDFPLEEKSMMVSQKSINRY